MKVVSLGSGSKGNSILISTEETNLLLDAGLNKADLEERLNVVGVKPEDINAILISHEHIDHCKSIGSFARKYGTKVYIPLDGYDFVINKLGKLAQKQIICFVNNDFFINDIAVTAFPLPHDSKFCFGYSFVKNNKKISIATDLGHTNVRILKNLQNSDILYLEANHDESMLLANPRYSDSLKNRILSPKGHLSNVACAKAIRELVGSGVKQVVLAHLSEENNEPLLAYKTVKNELAKDGIIEGKHIFIDVALQHEVGTIFEIKDI